MTKTRINTTTKGYRYRPSSCLYNTLSHHGVQSLPINLRIAQFLQTLRQQYKTTSSVVVITVLDLRRHTETVKKTTQLIHSSQPLKKIRYIFDCGRTRKIPPKTNRERALADAKKKKADAEKARQRSAAETGQQQTLTEKAERFLKPEELKRRGNLTQLLITPTKRKHDDDEKTPAQEKRSNSIDDSDDDTVMASNNDCSGLSNNRFAILGNVAEDISTSSQSSRSNTTRSVARSIDRKYKKFLDIKLRMPTSKDARKTLQEQLARMFRNIKDACSSFVIYEYAHDIPQRAITAEAQITGDLQSLRTFFNGVYPREKEGDTWFNLYIGSDDDMDTFSTNVRWWFQQNKAYLRIKELQVRDSEKSIWFFYSHEKINKELLCEAIKEQASTVHKEDVNIALTWNPIKDGVPYSAGKKQTRALHVECPKTEMTKTKALIAKMYGSDASDYPLDIKLRYSPTITKDTTSYTKQKILALKTKQDWFLSSIEHATSFEITTLDRQSSRNEGSLRDYVMEMKTRDGKHALYLGVNEDPRGSGIVFTFAKKFEDEARDMVTNLPAYLAFKYTNKALVYFSVDAVTQAK